MDREHLVDTVPQGCHIWCFCNFWPEGVILFLHKSISPRRMQNTLRSSQTFWIHSFSAYSQNVGILSWAFFFFFNDHFMLSPWTVPYNPVALIITYNLMTPKFKLPTQTSFLNIRHTDPISYRHFHLVVLLAYSLSMCKSHLSPLPHLFIPSHAMGRVCMCVLVCLGELH